MKTTMKQNKVENLVGYHTQHKTQNTLRKSVTCKRIKKICSTSRWKWTRIPYYYLYVLSLIGNHSTFIYCVWERETKKIKLSEQNTNRKSCRSFNYRVFKYWWRIWKLEQQNSYINSSQLIIKNNILIKRNAINKNKQKIQ